jgi:glucose-6-phosphate isomerase
MVDYGREKMAVEQTLTNLGIYEAEVKAALASLNDADIVRRIWGKDHTVWKTEPSEIINRLGWLDVISNMSEQSAGLKTMAQEVKEAGFRHIVLLGMGGSSLGAEVMGRVFGSSNNFPELIVLDSTLPESIQAVSRVINPALTLFLVSSKSGTTTEPLLLFDYFWDLVQRTTGKENAGRNFIAITDAGTPLVSLARENGFRQVFLNPADIGGRYSILSYFGLVPAALAGIDIAKFLQRAKLMKDACAPEAPVKNNPGLWLGACMGAMALKGVDKLTLVTSPSVNAFGLWVEQLMAESTGKDGKGIIPVANEPLMQPGAYGHDRLFVYLRIKGDPNRDIDQAINRLVAAGQPVVVLDLRDVSDLGAEFFRWEFAAAVAGALLRINPFDQPDVQSAKEITGRILTEYAVSGRLPVLERSGSLPDLLKQAEKGRYLVILAYLRQTPELDEDFIELRRVVGDRYHIATVLGYGPRYLHSTGQLFKGGQNRGLFLQLTANHEPDLPIPGKPYTFGTVADAQARGDFDALQKAGRQVISLRIPHSQVSVIKKLLEHMLVQIDKCSEGQD